MTIFLSGRISGLEYTYKEIFNRAYEKLADQGNIVLNPATLPRGLDDNSYMPICLTMLNACDAIYLLDGWEESKGANLEKAFAEYQGKIVLYERGD